MYFEARKSLYSLKGDIKMRKKIIALLLAALFIVMPTALVSANDYLDVSLDNLPADTTEYTYFVVSVTFVGDPSLKEDYLQFTTLEDLLGEDINAEDFLHGRMTDAKLSADGLWSLTVEAVTVFRIAVELDEDQEEAVTRAPGFFASNVLGGPFHPVNGIITVPLTISHTHRSAAGRFYSGTIHRMESIFIADNQGNWLWGYGRYSGMIPFIGMWG